MASCECILEIERSFKLYFNRSLKNAPWLGDEGGFVAIVVSDLAFEAAVVAQVGPSVTGDLVAFVGAVPFEVDAVRSEAAVERGVECAEGHFALAVVVDVKESRPAQIEMLSRPRAGLDDPPFANEAIDVRHHPVSSSFGNRTRL